ncbi:MAG TPA: hypothetical protein VFA76_02540 [Terriglobales bacterium]|nr:hypothetical protein [Terriglobales bacterium]
MNSLKSTNDSNTLNRLTSEILLSHKYMTRLAEESGISWCYYYLPISPKLSLLGGGTFVSTENNAIVDNLDLLKYATLEDFYRALQKNLTLLLPMMRAHRKRLSSRIEIIKQLLPLVISRVPLVDQRGRSCEAAGTKSRVA